MSQKAWPRLTIRLPSELKRAFEDYCVETGSNPSETGRLMIAKLLEGRISVSAEQMATRNAYARAYTDIIGAIEHALGRFR